MLALLAASIAQPAAAQDVSGDACSKYVTAYADGAAAYAPYLQLAAVVAISRDAFAGGAHYTLALRGATPDANAQWLDAWCKAHPQQSVREAASRLLDARTGETSPAGMTEPAPAAMPAPPPLRPRAATQPPRPEN